MRTKFLVPILAAVGCCILSGPAQAALFLGETFTLSLNVSDANQTSFEDVTPSIGPFTVDGTSVDAGASLFDPNVRIEVTATENELSPTNSLVTIFIVGVDSNGDLANPIADGSTAASGDPFNISFLDLGAFNGGTDGLAPSSNPFGPDYIVNDSVVVVVGTDGNTAGVSFQFSSSAPDPISGFGGANLGGDLSTLDLNTVLPTAWDPGSEFAGMAVQFDISAVPEPSSVAFLGISMIGISRIRRRR